MELNRQFKYKEAVYIFTCLVNGLPVIEKGKITGVIKATGIYSHNYYIEVNNDVYMRYPDAIFTSVEEIKRALADYVIG